MLYEAANAKINLFLDVTGRRDDGYHSLVSCMQTVDFGDTVSADIRKDVTGQHFTLSCSDPSLPCDETNLAHRAAMLFLQKTEIADYDIRMRIDKRIPISAGLGGGSADAAAVLRMLNKYYGYPLDTPALSELGKRLGADVPFCIVGGTCYCEGIGELLEPTKTDKPDYTVLIAKTDERMSTAEAFARLDDLYGDFSARPESVGAQCVIDALSCGDVTRLAKSVYNIFESAVFPIRPQARELKQKLLHAGALCALMSGSGPSVFGIFLSDIRAEICASAMRKQGHFAVACRTSAQKNTR